MDNFITDIERTLKQGFEYISLNDTPVPLKVVTPDPDFVELTLPCLTLQLTDIRQDFKRTDNEREVVKDLHSLTAKVKGNTRPYNLHYLITAHTEKSRDDRLLLGEVIYFFDEHPTLTSVVLGKELYLERDISFRELSKNRNFAKAIGIVIKTRLEAREERIIPLVKERLFQVELRRS